MFNKSSRCFFIIFLFGFSFFSQLVFAANLNQNNKFTSTNSVNGNSHAKISSVQEVKLTNNSKYGKILTDGTGRTLYFFTNDKDSVTSACNGQCAAIWPVFYADSLTIGTGLNADNFGKITRTDGSFQTTYKGWPLYYFSGDTSPGNVNGDGFKGIWFVAKPNYTVMLMNNQLVGEDGKDYNENYQPGTQIIQYFVDPYGRTLYVFTHDTYDKNNFTKPDFSNNSLWAIYEDSVQAFPSAMNSSYFGTINVYGHKQLTYKGWPLYEFGPDSLNRGSTKGVSFPSPGVWPVAQISLDSATVTGVIEDYSSASIPREYSLSQNYPNPFNPSTVISYNLPVSSFVKMKVFNILGKKVATLVNGIRPAGKYRITFNASGLPSGIYFYSLITGNGNNFVKKMILLK